MLWLSHLCGLYVEEIGGAKNHPQKGRDVQSIYPSQSKMAVENPQ